MLTKIFYTFRNISKNGTNSVITVIGLSVAVACCLIIFCFVNQEYSFNNFHKNANRIYRINYTGEYTNFTYDDVRVRKEVARDIKDKFPQIEYSTEFRKTEQILKFNNECMDFTMGVCHKDFFSMFNFEIFEGERNNLFNTPDEIVLTKDLADKLLQNNENYNSLIGKTIDFPFILGDRLFTITGILDNIPKNSSLQFEALIRSQDGGRYSYCDNYFGYTAIYYQLKNNKDAELVENNVEAYLVEYYETQVEGMKRNNILKSTPHAFNPYIIPFTDTYLSDHVGNCFESSNNTRNFIILIIIGSLILIIACSNYTILSMGQYLKKIGDVGVRKTMGANRLNIFSLFFAEGAVLTLLSFILGILLCLLLLPVFNRLAQTEIYIELIDIPQVLLFVVVAFFAIVIITSIIPVLVFSKVNPHQMSGNKLNIGKRNFISQFFVSFQYSLSIILIIVTIFIVRQANFLKNKDLGFSSENMLSVDIFRLTENQKNLFRDKIKDHPGIVNLTFSSRNFVNGSSDDWVDNGEGERITVYKIGIDDNYISTLGLKLLYGENFKKSNIKRGDRNILVNKSFVDAFDIKKDPVGRTYNISGTNFTILGVVSDFHFFSTHSQVRPAMLYANTNYNSRWNVTLVRYKTEQLQELISHMKACYTEISPDQEFTYDFWDERLGERYQSEERWSKIIGYAAAIAILISSLGLFGLTILHINQRIKEIGVRKVNGANVSEVLVAINKTFAIWLFGSLIIAIPVAYQIVIKILSEFAYKVNISWWVFIISGIVALAIAILTVSWRSWTAANRNPVEALRYE